MNKNQLKWTIFVVSMFLFPTYFHLILDTAIWPVLYPLLGFLVPAILRGHFQGIFYLLPSILFWSFLLYFVSKWLSRKIINDRGIRNSKIVVSLLVIVSILCVVPIYQAGTTSQSKSTVIPLYLHLLQ